MGKAAVPSQILAIIGLGAVLGGTHSLIVPISLERESTGFVIPDSQGESPDQPDTSPDPESTTAPAGATSPSDPSEQPADEESSDSAGAGKIDLALAASLHERAMMGEPIWFLDARREEDFVKGHIAGAMFMSHTSVSSGDGLDRLAMFSTPELGDLLVIYCTGGDCQASEDTAILLEQAGYTNMAIMEAGYDEWVAAGHPTEEGP